MTKQHITPGRWRGLKSASTDKSAFTILAFDQRGSYRKMLPEGSSYEDAVNIKNEVVGALTQTASAVLLDAMYGLSPAMHMRGGAGLLMALEESGYTGDSTYRKLLFNPDWTVNKIKQMGGTAVKLLVYYHPHSGALVDEIEQDVKAVIDECHKYDLPLFLEPVSYSLDASISKESDTFASTRPQVVVETARRLGKLAPDVLKLEFPYDAAYNQDVDAWRAACEEVSAVASVPWVLLSAGVEFETFALQTEIACKAGASGWLAGRAIWKEVTKMNPAERATFINGKATARTQKLAEIANANATPWTDFYAPLPASAEWYKTYSG
jgi:tagatose 1,6-diphosphate aldolase